MTKSKEKPLPHNGRRGSKIVKARYDAKTHFAAFDICAIRLDGKRAGVLGRGTFEGKDFKSVTKLLTRVAETFACRELHLERVGSSKLAGTFVEISGSNGISTSELAPKPT
jgi:hypothetical protein